MGITSSKADSAPPPMPNFTKGSSPVVEQALKDLKEEQVRLQGHSYTCSSSATAAAAMAAAYHRYLRALI